MKGSGDFIFDLVDKYDQSCHKISLNRGGTHCEKYRNFTWFPAVPLHKISTPANQVKFPYFSQWPTLNLPPDCIKNKHDTINPQNNKKESFKQAVTNALHHEQTQNHSEIIISNLLLFPIKDTHQRNLSFHQIRNIRKHLSKKTETASLNISFLCDVDEITQAYISKFTFLCEHQVISLMISDGNKWNYLEVTKLSALLNDITLKHKVTFYCLNSLHFFPKRK